MEQNSKYIFDNLKNIVIRIAKENNIPMSNQVLERILKAEHKITILNHICLANWGNIDTSTYFKPIIYELIKLADYTVREQLEFKKTKIKAYYNCIDNKYPDYSHLPLLEKYYSIYCEWKSIGFFYSFFRWTICFSDFCKKTKINLETCYDLSFLLTNKMVNRINKLCK